MNQDPVYDNIYFYPYINGLVRGDGVYIINAKVPLSISHWLTNDFICIPSYGRRDLGLLKFYNSNLILNSPELENVLLTLIISIRLFNLLRQLNCVA